MTLTSLPTHLRQGLRAVEAWMKLAARSEMAAMDTIRCALAIVGALVISMQVGWRCCNDGTCCGVADVVVAGVTMLLQVLDYKYDQVIIRQKLVSTNTYRGHTQNDMNPPTP